MRRALSLALTLALSACAAQPSHVASAQHHRRRRARRSATPPSAPVTPAAAARCAPLLAANRAVLGRAPRGALARWPVLSAFETCVDAGAGAWALRLESLHEERVEGALELTGSWSLVFLSDVPERSIRPWSEGATGPEVNLTCIEGDECTSIDTPTAFDHDHDGRAELALVVRRIRMVGGIAVSSGFGRLWTVRDDGLDAYDPSRELVVTEHRDLDGDGRPELFTYGPYVAEAPGPCGRGAWPLHGPALVAHSLPDGGFSLDDDVARGARVRTCAEPADDASYHGALQHAARAVVCARLAGRDADAAMREMRAVPRPDAPRCRRGTPDDRDVLSDWARRAPWIAPRP